MLRDLLAREGFNVGRRHVGTLMAKMGIEALYRKPSPSRGRSVTSLETSASGRVG
jgi:putative transposase